ncbi:MAG: hypothetical protein ACYDHY_07200 [Acidiferrobacterales bacterium]
MTIKDMVKDNKKVRFEYFVAGELWYVTDDGFKFPVPVADAGTGCFLVEDKAILFMRYIRKHLEMIEKAKQEQNAPMVPLQVSYGTCGKPGLIYDVFGHIGERCDCQGHDKGSLIMHDHACCILDEEFSKCPS